MEFEPSSLTVSEPSGGVSAPTGRPETSPLSVTKPEHLARSRRQGYDGRDSMPPCILPTISMSAFSLSSNSLISCVCNCIAACWSARNCACSFRRADMPFLKVRLHEHCVFQIAEFAAYAIQRGINAGISSVWNCALRHVFSVPAVSA